MRFIVDVSRGFGVENAMRNLDLTLRYRNDSIIGIGLGGAESKGPAAEFAGVFEKAAANGLHVVAHAGEDVGPESIWDTLKTLKAERIGHGLSAMTDEELMRVLARERIPIECCPSSNVFTKKYIRTLEEHPLRLFHEKGMMVTLNTDDPTIFGVELIDEYLNAYLYQGFDLDQLIQLLKNGVEATFLPAARKKQIWADREKTIKALRAEYF